MKVTVIEIKHYQLKNKTRPYLKDFINNLKKFDTGKIQLTIAYNFISFIDNHEERVMHSKSDNIEILINDEADELIKQLLGSLRNRYQNNLQLIKGSEFVFDYVHLLYYKCHKINPNRGGSYIDSPDWIKNKISVRLKSKRQRINTVTFYLRDISMSLVGVLFKHIDQIQEPLTYKC